MYFETGERQAIHFEIAGRMLTKCSKTRSLSIRKNIRLRQEKLVETRVHENDILDNFKCRSDSNKSEPDTQRSNEENNKNTRNNKRSKGDKLLEFFWKFPSSPINNLFNNTEWFNSTWKYLPLNHTHIKAVQRIFQRQLCDMSIIDFMNKFQESETLFYNCGVRDVNDYYYTTDQSIAIELLMFQFCNSADRVKEFLCNLHNIEDRLVPKKNCMFILSQPNAGKNFFFDAAIHYFLSFGQIGNLYNFL